MLIDTEQIKYYGKLRRSREFIYAKNLADNELQSWSLWFNKCRNNNSLLPFIENQKKPIRKWVFIISNELEQTVGITSISEDLAGRKYPFVVYVRLSKYEKREQVVDWLCYFLNRFNKFEQIITDGIFNSNTLVEFCSEKLNNEFNEGLLDIMNDALTSYQSTEIYSLWLDVKTTKMISYQNRFTCSLYNKIYG